MRRQLKERKGRFVSDTQFEGIQSFVSGKLAAEYEECHIVTVRKQR